MTKQEIEEALREAYRNGYGDNCVRGFNFHNDSYEVLDNFIDARCVNCAESYKDKECQSRGNMVEFITPDFGCVNFVAKEEASI